MVHTVMCCHIIVSCAVKEEHTGIIYFRVETFSKNVLRVYQLDFF